MHKRTISLILAHTHHMMCIHKHTPTELHTHTNLGSNYNPRPQLGSLHKVLTNDPLTHSELIHIRSVNEVTTSTNVLVQ